MRENIVSFPSSKKQIVDALLEKIENKYKNDISLVACYGSYITGTANPRSDLDFYFIPKTEKGYEMSYQFIIDDIGYDFWPISWKRAERLANFEEPFVSIIADAKVVYYGDDDDKKRYNLLKKRIEEITNPENKELLLGKVENILVETKALYYDVLRNDHYAMVRTASTKILSNLLTAVAYINSTYLKKGPANAENEIKSFSILPDRFIELFNFAIRSHNPQDILDTVKKLIENVSLLITLTRTKSEVIISIDTIKGFYEELKSTYNKLIYACDTKDYTKAFFAAEAIDRETKEVLGERYQEFRFPNLVIPIDNNYGLLKERAIQHEKNLVSILNKFDVDINIYTSIDEFTSSLNI